MKNFFTLIILMLSTTFSFAQKATDWSKSFPSKVKWYKITDAGILVAGTNDGLYGINPTDGKELWKIDQIENIQEENYDPIEGTPYIVLAKNTFLKSVNNIVDVVSGKVVANTKALGLAGVSKRLHLIKSNTMLFYGIGNNSKPMLMLVNLADGTKVWEQSKLYFTRGKLVSFYYQRIGILERVRM